MPQFQREGHHEPWISLCGRHVKGVSTASFTRPLWSLESMSSLCQKYWKIMISEINPILSKTIEFQRYDRYFPFLDMLEHAQVSQCWSCLLLTIIQVGGFTISTACNSKLHLNCSNILRAEIASLEKRSATDH